MKRNKIINDLQKLKNKIDNVLKPQYDYRFNAYPDYKTNKWQKEGIDGIEKCYT